MTPDLLAQVERDLADTRSEEHRLARRRHVLTDAARRLRTGKAPEIVRAEMARVLTDYAEVAQ